MKTNLTTQTALEKTAPQEPTLNLKPETLNPPTRVGKIARLPVETREYINQSLRGGHPHSAIVATLEKMGHPGISTRNISNWKFGGYVNWLKEQHELEARLATTKALERYTRSGEIDRIQQNAIALAADQMMAIMAHFDHQRALDLLYEKPELFPRYIAALAALARCTADLGKAFDVSQIREAAVRQQQITPTNTIEHPFTSTIISTTAALVSLSSQPGALPPPTGEADSPQTDHVLPLPEGEVTPLAPDPIQEDRNATPTQPSEPLPATVRNCPKFQPTETNGR